MFKNLILPFICLFLVSVIFLQIGELADKQLAISELEARINALQVSNQVQLDMCKQANDNNLREVIRTKNAGSCIVSGSGETSFSVSCD